MDEKFLKLQRSKGRELKKSRWWQNKISEGGLCYYCDKKLTKLEITMDHIVPISRGGRSTKGNVVMACETCNINKRSLTAVEWEESLMRMK
jgi:5-methylcytosine-specific restriction enzyme A